MTYDELTIDERNHDLCFRHDNDEQRYAIVIMYSIGTGNSKYVTSQPLKEDSVYPKLENILNDIEQERMVCLNSHFINPKNVISVKVALYRDYKKKDDDNFDGEYYS